MQKAVSKEPAQPISTQTEAPPVHVCQGCYRKMLGAFTFCSPECQEKEARLAGQAEDPPETDPEEELDHEEELDLDMDNSFIEYEKFIS